MLAPRHLLVLAALASSLHALAQSADQPGGQDGKSGETSATQQRTANRFVVGVLVDARTIRVEGAEGFHQLIKLENRDGRQLVVDLGSSPSPEALGLREGDLIVVLGKSARINGQPVLYALYIAPLTELSEVRRSRAGVH